MTKLSKKNNREEAIFMANNLTGNWKNQKDDYYNND